uniref:Mucin-2-like n=1 Tax=Strongyloides stercoralis TaxID=6248 RepID=A0A0K0E1E7_STRER
MVWRNIFLLLIFFYDFRVNTFSPPGINPSIFNPSVIYQQEHRPVISKDGSSNIPRSPYEPPTAIFATRPPLPGYYKATKPYTRGPFPFIPVTESPFKIGLKNPQDLLEELKNNKYYGESENNNNKETKKIVSDTGIFYPVEKTLSGELIGYVNVPYYEVPAKQSVKSPNVVIYDNTLTSKTTTTTTTTTTITSTTTITTITTTKKSITTTKKTTIPEIVENQKFKIITTGYIQNTEPKTNGYPVIDIAKYTTTSHGKTFNQLPDINKYNYPNVNEKYNKYSNSKPNNNYGYEAVPISPEMYYGSHERHNMNYNNLQPSPPMSGGYYGPQPPVTKKKSNSLRPFFTRTKSHLATISPITEKNINSIVYKIKNKITPTSYTTFTPTTTRPIKTTKKVFSKPPSTRKVTQIPWWMISTTKKPLTASSTDRAKFEEGYFTITTRKPITTKLPKISPSTLIHTTSQFPKTTSTSTVTSTTKPPIVIFQTTTKKPLISIPPVTSKTIPPIIIYQKSTKIVSLPPPSTTGTPSVELLSTVSSTKKVEQSVTFRESKKLDKEEIKGIKSSVEFEITNTYPTIVTITTPPRVTFEKGPRVVTEKFETEPSIFLEGHTPTRGYLEMASPKVTTVKIEPSSIEYEEEETSLPPKIEVIEKITPTPSFTVKPSTIGKTFFTETPKIFFPTTTSPQTKEFVTHEVPKTTTTSSRKEPLYYTISSKTTLKETQTTTFGGTEISRTPTTKTTQPRVEITSVPFTVEKEITSVPFTVEKEITSIPSTVEKETFESPTTRGHIEIEEIETTRGGIVEVSTTEKPYIQFTTTEKEIEVPSLELSTPEQIIPEIVTTEGPIFGTSSVKYTEKPSIFTPERIGNVSTSTKLFTEGEKMTTIEVVGTSTPPETSTLNIPQLSAESLFPEQEGIEETFKQSTKTTEGFYTTKEMATEESQPTTIEKVETFETTPSPSERIESTIIPTEIFPTQTSSPTEEVETKSTLAGEFEIPTEATTESVKEIEASSHAFITKEPEIISTQKGETETIPFTPSEELFTVTEAVESTTNPRIIVDFDSEGVTKNLTELCSTTMQTVSTSESETTLLSTFESEVTEITTPSTEKGEESTTRPTVEILFPTSPGEGEHLTTQKIPTTSEYPSESTKILEFTTVKPVISEETEVTEQTTFIPTSIPTSISPFITTSSVETSTITTSSVETSTLGKSTIGEEVFPTEFTPEASTTNATFSTEAFSSPSPPTTIETTTKLIKSIVIIEGKKKLNVLEGPKGSEGTEFISPNMTITKILDKSTNKFIPNGKKVKDKNLIPIQVTTDMEKSVEMEDVDFEKALEKELDEMIPRILKRIEEEEKEKEELEKKLEKGVGEELEKEIKNNDDVGGEMGDLLNKNSKKVFIDRDYPDFDPPKDKVSDSSVFVEDGMTASPCPYEPFVPSEPPIDVMFLIDGTKSMSGDNFIRSLKMMGDFVMKFDNIGPNGTQFSLVQFTSQPFFEFSFKKHSCRDEILKDIIETSYMKGDNRTNDLDIILEKVNKFGFSYLRGNRPEAKDVLIIFNGNEEENNNIGNAMEKLKKNDIEVFAVCEDEDSEKIFKDILPPKNVMSLEDGNKEVVDTITDSIKKVDNKNSNNNDNVKVIKIDCAENELRIVLEVPKSYQGIFTTKNHLNNSLCSKKVPMEIGDGYKQLGFTFKNNDCGLDILHNDELNGKNYSIVLNVLKDNKEISENDKSYLVQCFAPNKNFDNDERKVITDNVPIDVVPPKCDYSLHRDSIDGPIVNLAVIGQTIYHKWECQGIKNVEDYYGMFIYNCYIGTHEKKNILEMVDSNGCGTNNTNIDIIKYKPDQMIAYTKSEIFSLKDIENIKFSCKIGLCLKKNGDCDGITPPQCSKNSNISSSEVIREDRQISPINQALENDVETFLQVIRSFHFGAQKLVNNNNNFSYKDLEGPIIPVLLITLIVSLSIFIAIVVYKKYKHPIYIREDDLFSSLYTSSNFYNNSFNNSSKLKLDDINFEDQNMYHRNCNFINSHKTTSFNV